MFSDIQCFMGEENMEQCTYTTFGKNVGMIPRQVTRLHAHPWVTVCSLLHPGFLSSPKNIDAHIDESQLPIVNK